MCGIIGYTGKKAASKIIIEGLRNLEYRGYDSAGIAALENGQLKRLRAVGKVKELETSLLKNKLSSLCAVGHTRWATHGKPSENNSHPHTDCGGNIAVVHNGIIENYLSLKEDLKKKGHKFKSETDTEVIAHLLEENLKTVKNLTAEQKLFEAVRKTAKQISGAFAVGIIWTGAPGIIVGIRKQSPLVAGIGDGESFLASDVTAFLKHTNKVVFLEDNEIVVARQNNISFYDENGKEKKPLITQIKWNTAQAEKGGYKHFMLKEIYEQPDAVADTLRFGVEDMPSVFGMSGKQIKNIKKIQIIACGTAYHAGLCSKYFIEEYSGIPVEVDYASEYKYRFVPSTPGTLAIAVSQSGETADTIAAMKKAKEAGFKTLAICNVLGSTLTRMADHTFFTRCGLEISVASTKAFTSQLAALYGLAVFLGFQRGVLNSAQFKKYSTEFFALPRLLENTIKNTAEAVKKTAKKIYKEKTFVFLGRSANYPIALEGALKLKEISYLHAEGFPGGEIKHGPIAIIDSHVPVFVLAPKDNLFEKMLSACEETAARGAKVIAVTDKKGAEILGKKVFALVKIPEANSFLTAILNAVVVQFFAYYIADLRKCEIDQPRNLAKSVTVE
ncbi:Glucosamine/fructose-6-phosphate aminotransferase, isomerizing [Elusimicrobium minutum Pei191]|uniref:Glutamine--fructose-6-phosphate aminotransferase [isomerizing] n=1 Tax=Elusimicrobium minutum (strain Pei191) TaxID=445932 RepID=B2KEC3_ELUMP|nr:glutamine--fructose-6-phosphate transaminase (isomerizing) [Elusimicrobium minutum]ACC98869.1 Glucosamine/fructose-6-phosphate aminotransferase, isomerizing [Elusimicrobium minutum Pei191]